MSDRHICKAKRTDNGEWVEGYYTYYPEGFGKTDDTKHTIRDTRTNPGKLYFVDPETICQCTGLPDKNGKKIFERDIIRYIDEIIGKEKIDEVKYNETYALFCRLHKSVMGLQHFFIDEAVANRCEAIGNIFDNPELLEGGAE